MQPQFIHLNCNKIRIWLEFCRAQSGLPCPDPIYTTNPLALLSKTPRPIVSNSALNGFEPSETYYSCMLLHALSRCLLKRPSRFTNERIGRKTFLVLLFSKKINYSSYTFANVLFTQGIRETDVVLDAETVHGNNRN